MGNTTDWFAEPQVSADEDEEAANLMNAMFAKDGKKASNASKSTKPKKRAKEKPKSISDIKIEDLEDVPPAKEAKIEDYPAQEQEQVESTPPNASERRKHSIALSVQSFNAEEKAGSRASSTPLREIQEEKADSRASSTKEIKCENCSECNKKEMDKFLAWIFNPTMDDMDECKKILFPTSLD